MVATAKKDLPIVQLKLDQIRIDGGTQSRADISPATVIEYSEHLDDLPPVDVFHDGVRYWLGDGFHRWHAHHKKHPNGTIKCRKHLGTVRDAILFAVGANAENALQLTDKDRRHACRMLLTDSEWKKWSDKEIARQCRVSPWLVGDEKKLIKEEEAERREKEKAAAERAAEKARQEAEAKAAAERAKVKEGWVKPGKKEEPPKPTPEAHHKDGLLDAPEDEKKTVRRNGTVYEMKTGTISKVQKGRDRNIIRLERDADKKKDILKQLNRSIPKAAKQAKRLGWDEEKFIEECRRVWQSIPTQ